MLIKKLSCGVSVAAIALVSATAVFAQETTGAIRGRVVNDAGQPIANATVTVTHVPSNTRSTVLTGADGYYNVRGLRVGGPYAVAADSAAGSTQSEIESIGIGDANNLDLYVGVIGVDDVVVTASAAGRAVPTAIGPTATFTAQELLTAPAINRDIRDVISIDPRINLDSGYVDGVQCAGASPRFNSLTVDGVRMNDNFGLNDSGYPTERMPFSFDTIEQVAVELAPFDVAYGRFTACNINAVTKSGGNQFHGGLFYDFNNNDLTGDSLEGSDIDLGEFEETRWGVHIGGPIIKDRLFFFASYEKLEGTNVFSRGPNDSSAGTPVRGLSQAQYDEILDIAKTVYGFDPGGIPQPQANEDEKIFVKLDWNINDRHRASFSYNRNEGFNVVESDGGGGNFEFSSHLYSRGSALDAYTGSLFSDWTDNFSTELRVAFSTLENNVIPQGGYEVGELRITTVNPDTGAQATVFMGADDSRHSNLLTYDTLTVRAAGAYVTGDHTFTFGYELESLDIFNMFVQHSLGEFWFANISDFRNGLVTDVDYGNARTLNPEDAAASFSYSTHTLFFQDKVRLTDALTVTAGLRYDWYATDDAPAYNANFFARQGFANDATLDGVGLLQPRFGFTYEYSPSLRFRGGAGLYSGGNPNVWISNGYSNDGITNVQVDLAGLGLASSSNKYNLLANGNANPLDIPPELLAAVTSASPNTAVNALDPAFKIPSAWKFSLGSTWWVDLPFLGEGVRLDGDLLYSDTQDAAVIRDLNLVQIGTMADGRPYYRGVNKSNPACWTSPATCPSRTNDFLLTNANGGYQFTASFSASQSYDWGLGWTVAYAYNEAEDVNPMTSSVAYSNWANVSVDDPNNMSVATSNYQTPHRVTLRLNYERAFFGDYNTRFTLFGRTGQTRPYSYTFANTDGGIFGDGVNGRHLLYVPTGPSDPNVVFASGFNQTAFFDFIKSAGLEGYAGGIAPRNVAEGEWWTKFDLRIEQELPGLLSGHKTAAFVVIENLGNLLNDEWGIMNEAGFPQAARVVAASRLADGRYQYNSFFTPGNVSRVVRPSLWEVRFGVRYNF